MSLSDLARRLEQSFRTSNRQLTRLLQGLRERRTAWISARPETVAPADELDALAGELADEDMARTALIGQLSKILPLQPGIAAEDVHINVTRIAEAIPPKAAQSLRLAADEATAVAKQVRRELALGRRLLGFAQRTHESLMADIATGSQSNDTNGYDRTAQACRGIGSVSASLIDGRM